MPMLYNGFTTDEMLGYLGRRCEQVSIHSRNKGDSWTLVVVDAQGIMSIHTAGTLFRATMEAFKPYAEFAAMERDQIRAKWGELQASLPAGQFLGVEVNTPWAKEGDE